MHPIITKKSTCRLCGGDNLELVVPLNPTPVAEKYVGPDELDKPTPAFPLDLYMCLHCAHVQMLDVVDPKFLFDSYTYESGRTQRIIQHFDEVAQSTMDMFSCPKGGLVVDIGSNDGTLLERFKHRGLRVLGVDPAREIALKATGRGIPTITSFMSPDLARSIRNQHGPASIVCAFNVFAHNDDLAGMAKSVRTLLGPGGVFVFEASYLLDIVQRMLLGTIFHEHVSHHSVTPLIPFLRQHNLELLNVQRNSIQGGSIVGTVGTSDGPHKPDESVQESVMLEQRTGLLKPDTLREFASRIAALRQRVHGLVTRVRDEGKSLWGYGAARSGTTLIAQMGLGSAISCIVDDSPDKQGKFSPGDHIPILPSGELYRQMPNYVIILAWIHSQSIIASNRTYLERGGYFVNCVPDVQIIGADSS